MLSRCFFLTLGPLIAVTSGCAALRTPPERKIYIVTDLEGASGVYKFAQTREPDNRLGETAKAYLMGDIAAVVRGLRAGGATRIVVLDGHGSQAFVPHLMEPGAEYITGKPRPNVLWGLDDSFAGLVLLGHHAMAGTPDGVLHHTQSSRTENRYWYNDVESGELAQADRYFGRPGQLDGGLRQQLRFPGTHQVCGAVDRAGWTRAHFDASPADRPGRHFRPDNAQGERPPQNDVESGHRWQDVGS